MPVSPRIRSQLKLMGAQLFAGAGIASGYAVGGLLAEQITCLLYTSPSPRD